ncbi:hypothetical protein [Phreatobacter oligotrophus]|uniref:Soluble lytic murein transglycosylase-like protein n=1 Tax=Phreatobacter oligotrophus TaxID=1122261 RepID=A0A2T4Z050_9HYPH|nr:hypothetical protein [Phreatobacter oligotrophus]PTM52864.1 hypothetical protein C8P69_107142 [Phreatobacter oligotrophus]
MTRTVRNLLLSAVAASALVMAQPLAAQAPHAIEVTVDEAGCIAAPTPACTAELALKAAAEEPEGWAATAAFEAFLQSDPDLAARDRWMARYEAWAKIATVDGIKERIVPVRAEHLARKGDFAAAYRELGLDQPQPAPLSEPSVLILDEARSGRVADALGRVDRLVESDSRDEIRLELLEIAIARAPAEADAVANQIKDRFTRRMAQALQAGARGDMVIARSIDEWARGARANQTAPFDDADTARRDSWDMVLRGAVAANNLEAFRKALAARPPFNSSADAESASRILRVLMREGRAEWIRAFGPALRLPPEDAVSVDEDIGGMRNLPAASLVAVAEAAEATGRSRGAVIDTAVEMLVGRGAVAEARDLFVRLGRIDELNRVTFDQERVGVVFETLWRAVVGRGPKEAVDAVAARITSEGAKAYIARVDGLATRMRAIASGTKAEEPADDEWAVMLDIAIASGDPILMTKIAASMKDAGLRSTAFVQVTKNLWERAAR